jgi:hypothetical protein
MIIIFCAVVCGHKKTAGETCGGFDVAVCQFDRKHQSAALVK